MGMTMTQKILAAHAGLESVKTGQLIMADLDLVLGNDITSPVAINEFEKNGFNGVFDKDKIALVMDHFAPNKDIKAAQQCKQCRGFARRFDISNYYDVGDMGIEHALLPEKGLTVAGDVIFTAKYTPVINQYTYVFKNDDGTEIRCDRKCCFSVRPARRLQRFPLCRSQSCSYQLDQEYGYGLCRIWRCSFTGG